MSKLEEQIKKQIKGNVEFMYARDGDLYYRTEDKFTFRVPMRDMGTATFNAFDRGILYMRWIRKELEGLQE